LTSTNSRPKEPADNEFSMNLKIDIIIAAKNAELTITETLDSIIRNRATSFIGKVVVIDDGSYDSTAKLAVSYSACLPIKVISLESSVGQSRARNIGIASSDADLLMILDSDDILIEGVIDFVLSEFKTMPDMSLISGEKISFGNWGVDSRQSNFHNTHGELADQIKKGRNPIVHSGTTFTRAWFTKTGGYDEKSFHNEDLHLWHAGLDHGTYLVVELPFIYYRTDRHLRSYRYWLQAEINGSERYRYKEGSHVAILLKLTRPAKYLKYVLGRQIFRR